MTRTDASSILDKTFANALNLRDFSEHLVVDFAVEPLEGVEVVWLNERWWLANGWNLLTTAVRADLEAALLDRFGVRATGKRSSDPHTRSLGADRYGSSFGSRRHGGSGRCGSLGHFNAKGVGRTPLVHGQPPLSHSDGRLSMVEAIREAIGAEISALELPHGAVPVVAVLRTGTGDAILVRPNFLRLAHFERSIFFGSAGFAGSDQHLDALRTQELVEVAVEGHAPGFSGLDDQFQRLAEQIGAAQAHRLWQGRFLSGNVAIDGALVDFGSFRATPSWRSFFGLPEEMFGGEAVYLRQAYDAVRASFEKYAPPGTLISPAPWRDVEATIAESFHLTASQALGLGGSPQLSRALTEILAGYRNAQRRSRVQVAYPENWALPWLNDPLVRRTCDASEHAHELAALDDIRALHWDAPPSYWPGLWSALARWTTPRPEMYYERSAIDFDHEVASLSERPIARRRHVADFIAQTLSKTVRAWPDIPPTFGVVGQTLLGHSTILYGFDYDQQGWRALLSGTPTEHGVALFGVVVEKTWPGRWLSCACDRQSMDQGLSITVSGRGVSAPPALFTYSPCVAAPHGP